jgi:hypothetical protein
MFGSFERHYPTEASLLRLAAAGDASLESLEAEYPIEMGRLIDLALVAESADGDLSFGSLCQVLNQARVL